MQGLARAGTTSLWLASMIACTVICCSCSADDTLIGWVKLHGGQSKVMVGQVGRGGARGTIATQDIHMGEDVASTPFSLLVKESAAKWLKAIHRGPKYNETFGPYMATLPRPSELLTSELFTNDHIRLLQCPKLMHEVRMYRGWAEQVWSGTNDAAEAGIKPLHIITKGAPITLQAFKHACALLGSRVMHFPDGKGQMVRYLVPLLDLANHSDEPNAVLARDGKAVHLRAKRFIRKGEEVSWQYDASLARPDRAAIHYGFLPPARPGLLAAVDLPGYSIQQSEYPSDDRDYRRGTKLSRAALKIEIHRLTKSLDGFLTTELHDLLLLTSSMQLPQNVVSWQAKLILAMRIQRKAALRRTLRSAYQTFKKISLRKSRRFLASALRPDRHTCFKIGSPLWKRWMLHFSGLP